MTDEKKYYTRSRIEVRTDESYQTESGPIEYLLDPDTSFEDAKGLVERMKHMLNKAYHFKLVWEQ